MEGLAIRMFVWQGKSVPQMEAELASIFGSTGLVLVLFPEIALFVKVSNKFLRTIVVNLVRIVGGMVFFYESWELLSIDNFNLSLNFGLFVVGSIVIVWFKIKFGYLIDSWFE